MSTEPYYADYPTEPIGRGNPYHRCKHCKRSVPEINGDLYRHESWCKYRQNKLRELEREKVVSAMEPNNHRRCQVNAVKICIAMLSEWHSVCDLMGWEPNHLKAFSDAETCLKTLSFTAKELREHSPQGYERALADYKSMCEAMGLESNDFDKVAEENTWQFAVDGRKRVVRDVTKSLPFSHPYGNRTKAPGSN